jgi:hypothetical protein
VSWELAGRLVQFSVALCSRLVWLSYFYYKYGGNETKNTEIIIITIKRKHVASGGGESETQEININSISVSTNEN